MASEVDGLSILTFNTLGTPLIRGHQKKNYLEQSVFLLRRFKKLGELLNDTDADVLALQEVHLYPLLFILKRRLTNYPYVYYKPHMYGPRGGMVNFSRYPLADCHYIDFLIHGSLRDLTFIYKITQNGILVTKLAHTPLYILNTTITADTDHDWSPQSKYNSLKTLQLSQLAYAMNTLSALRASVVAVGDFNMPQNSPQYEDFLSQTQAKNIFADYQIPTQHADFLPRDLERIPRLDYIFVKSPTNFVVEETRHVFREKVLMGKRSLYLSDHLALFAKVDFATEHISPSSTIPVPARIGVVN